MTILRINSNPFHHAFVLVLQNVTVKDEVSDLRRFIETHCDFEGRDRTSSHCRGARWAGPARYPRQASRANLARRRPAGSYACYYNGTRTHRSLDKDTPVHRPIQRIGNLTSRPILGGLHHQYIRI